MRKAKVAQMSFKVLNVLNKSRFTNNKLFTNAKLVKNHLSCKPAEEKYSQYM